MIVTELYNPSIHYINSVCLKEDKIISLYSLANSQKEDLKFFKEQQKLKNNPTYDQWITERKQSLSDINSIIQQVKNGEGTITNKTEYTINKIKDQQGLITSDHWQHNIPNNINEAKENIRNLDF